MTRELFEQWYVTNAFDFEKNPLGSRECSLQWQAWQAATKAAEPKQVMVTINDTTASYIITQALQYYEGKIEMNTFREQVGEFLRRTNGADQ